MPDNLPEHGAGAQPSHDPQEERRWTGTASVSHERRITEEDGCFTEGDAERLILGEVCRDHCEAWPDA